MSELTNVWEGLMQGVLTGAMVAGFGIVIVAGFVALFQWIDPTRRWP